MQQLHLMFLQDSEDLSSAAESSFPKPRPQPGKHDDKEENKEGDVSGLINSDGEEEDWKPVLVGMSPSPIPLNWIKH